MMYDVEFNRWSKGRQPTKKDLFIRCESEEEAMEFVRRKDIFSASINGVEVKPPSPECRIPYVKKPLDKKTGKRLRKRVPTPALKVMEKGGKVRFLAWLDVEVRDMAWQAADDAQLTLSNWVEQAIREARERQLQEAAIPISPPGVLNK